MNNENSKKIWKYIQQAGDIERTLNIKQARNTNQAPAIRLWTLK